MRWIVFLLILYLLYQLAFRYLPNLIRFLLKEVEKRPRRFPEADAHDMIPCSACGTWVSKNLALSEESGKFFCSEKCRRH